MLFSVVICNWCTAAHTESVRQFEKKQEASSISSLKALLSWIAHGGASDSPAETIGKRAWFVEPLWILILSFARSTDPTTRKTCQKLKTNHTINTRASSNIHLPSDHGLLLNWGKSLFSWGLNVNQAKHTPWTKHLTAYKCCPNLRHTDPWFCLPWIKWA